MIYPAIACARAAFSITPHNSNNFPTPARGVYVGGAGNITALMMDGTVVLFTAVPVGTILPIECARINSTGTTATLLVGLSN
jgi:hypothetical protein